MVDQEGDLEDDFSDWFPSQDSSPRKFNPPTPQELASAAAASQERHGRSGNHTRKKVTKFKSDVEMVAYGKVEQAYTPRPATFKLFPDAERLGREAELTLFSVLLGLNLRSQRELVATKPSRERYRELALGSFVNNHAKKAFAVGDIIYRNIETIAEGSAAEAINEVFSYVSQKHGGVQLGLPGFATVIFGRDKTVQNLQSWTNEVASVAQSTPQLYFEQAVETFCGRQRVLTHPVDITYQDHAGVTHIVEISNSNHSGFDQPARLVEGAFVELTASRIIPGDYRQQINFLSRYRNTGVGTLWPIKNLQSVDVDLDSQQLQQALELMQTAKIKKG